MLAMANAAPVQEDQKNLQGLLDALADQKTNMESVVQAANLVKQQQDNDGSEEAEAQFFGKLLKKFLWTMANKQQNYNGNEAEAQFFGKLLKSLWANKQNYDENEAKAQFIGRLLANVQQGTYDDTADAQFWGTALRLLAPHVFKYVKKRYG